uniref:FHA domain-containing protein n=1 Tax=Desertihabitans aurantiacus TaxID=2282477 RepID=UPI0013003456
RREDDEPAPAGPLVLATLCPEGHPNPPDAPVCRRCGERVPNQQPRLLPRPVQLVVHPPEGRPVEVDRVILVGRSPSAARGPGDARLLTVPSPHSDISRTHLQLAPEGWDVTVTDLHSTNGTTLARPGESPRRLTPGEPVVVQPGWQLHLGDGVTLTLGSSS